MARKNSTKKGGIRRTSRRAYMPKRKSRRRARKNPTARDYTSVMVWGAGAALGGSWVKRYLGQVTGSPMAAEWGTTAALGFLGWWLASTKKRTAPAGYAVLGIAMAHAAEAIGKGTGLFPESGQNFVPRSKVVRALPQKVNIQAANPVAKIVVPA